MLPTIIFFLALFILVMSLIKAIFVILTQDIHEIFVIYRSFCILITISMLLWSYLFYLLH